jgi:hypothetical protein
MREQKGQLASLDFKAHEVQRDYKDYMEDMAPRE